jgi:integrase/recombinase XerD
MTRLRQRMIEDMQLRSLSKTTQDAYVRAVKRLAEHYGKSPEHIGEEELRQYFLYLKNGRQVSPSAFKVALYGIKFFYKHTLRKEWPTLNLVRPTREKKLPVVLSIAEVRQILGCLRYQRYRVCLSTIYSCGLRLQEGVHLQVKDIDSDRMVVHIRKGKRSKDRYVPLPERTLQILRSGGPRTDTPSGSFPVGLRWGRLHRQPPSQWVSVEYSAPFGLRCRRVGFGNQPLSIVYAMRMLRIYLRPELSCASSKSTWDIARLRPQHSTPI